MTHGGKVDVAIAGAGIVGLAHAYVASRLGRSVAVFERNPAAIGASIRNFGMIWPIGLAAGPLYDTALRSRALWLEVLGQAGLSYKPTGSLHVAYRDDEAVVGEEFADLAPALGVNCQWLDPAETLVRTSAIRSEGLLGALYSETELTVDPRQVVRTLPGFLAEQCGVQFHFNTAVSRVGTGVLEAGTERCEAESIIVAGGDDFQTLFAAEFADRGVTRSKLQMMRTAPQPGGWALGPSLAFGLTFTHYPAFRICPSLSALEERITRETPALHDWGIHVMVSQTALGELTIGDSHENGLAVDIFDKLAVSGLILDYARERLRVPTLEVAQQWHGVYAKHADHPYVEFFPAPGVQVITVTNGLGMTLSFGLAEQTFRRSSKVI